MCIKGKSKGKETIPPVEQKHDIATGDNLQDTSQDANMTSTSAQIRPISNLAERTKRNLHNSEEGEDIYASKTIIINNLKKLFFYFQMDT